MKPPARWRVATAAQPTGPPSPANRSGWNSTSEPNFLSSSGCCSPAGWRPCWAGSGKPRISRPDSARISWSELPPPFYCSKHPCGGRLLRPRGRSCSDPVRVIQAVAIGIGFLGSGSIFMDKNHERVLWSQLKNTVRSWQGLQ